MIAVIRIRVLIFSLRFEIQNNRERIVIGQPRRLSGLPYKFSSHRLTVDPMNPETANLRACRHEIDVVNRAFITPHIDQG